MPNRGGVLANDPKANAAGKEATKGAVFGAARWGLYAGVAGVAAYAFSPTYRVLTIQFKVFLQASAMTMGAMIEGDKRLRQFEHRQRLEQKFRRNQAIWNDWEQRVEESGSLEPGKS
ncbi:MAG: hypothetical protein M1814_003664 [Vezdaea aestivalis]|nr:MAG: hypothetical protein M1814_003664 [Vezdaea aestivalis]